MKKIIILGADGMLGGMVTAYLSSNKKYKITACARTTDTAFRTKLPLRFDYIRYSESVYERLRLYDYVINCIGCVKSRCQDTTPESLARALEANVLIPLEIYNEIRGTKTKCVQIATDCAFSGRLGEMYVEPSPRNATDLYGSTKALGEINTKEFINLRCSIIGPGLLKKSGLLDWFLAQTAEVNGFTNHWWNGLTTLQFAKVCEQVIDNKIHPLIQHVVPADSATKYELLKLFAKYFNKKIKINPVKNHIAKDMTLGTNSSDVNNSLFGGEPPTIDQMVKELAQYKI